jgi:hypothetical protein
MCPDGGTGRRAGLKIRFSQESGSSTLPLGTIGSLARQQGATQIIAILDGDLSEAESDQIPHIPVDMSKWVAYSLRLSAMKPFHSHEIGPIFASATTIHSLNLTKEAAHA